MTDAEWLIEWRKKRAEAKNRHIPLSSDAFGVRQVSSVESVYQYARENNPVAFILLGSPYAQARMSSDLEMIRSVSKDDAMELGNLSSAMSYDYWPALASSAHAVVRSGHSVVVVGCDKRRLEAFSSSLFSNGARSVVVVDPTTMYEEDWRKDGVTGVFWARW